VKRSIIFEFLGRKSQNVADLRRQEYFAQARQKIVIVVEKLPPAPLAISARVAVAAVSRFWS
jgi:hypothetical protein